MELVKHIEELLERYFEAETSLLEEQELQSYFSGEDIAPHLEQFKPMFAYLSKAQTETFTGDLPLKPRKNKAYLKWISVAAVAVLAVGIFFNQPPVNSLEEEYTQEELQSAQMALAIFSDNFKKGTEGMTYLTEFEKNTNKFLINE